MRYQAQIGVPSENGWPMCSSASCVSEMVVPAAKRVPLRAGDVATILNAWLILYNREVEPITSQVWGWSADNDVWNSNHMSGTAVDIGAPKYPWGQRTMPSGTKAKVRALLAKFEGVIFWALTGTTPTKCIIRLVCHLATPVFTLSPNASTMATSAPPAPTPPPRKDTP